MKKAIGNRNQEVILIVDDKQQNLISLEGLLSEPNRTILIAQTGEQALKILLKESIDLIILDVQMPGMDGFEVAQILKSNKKTRDIPIIFASAEQTGHKSLMKGYREGAVDYLSKPLDPEIAKAKVAVLLQLQMQRKELLEKNASLEHASLLINNSADIIGIIDTATFRIEEINNAFTSILGYSEEETRETMLTFFLTDEDRVMIQELARKDEEQLAFETRIYCRDRSIKWLQWRVVAKRGKWFVNARDVTEIKQVEKIRNYIATVVKQSIDAIYIHDEEGKIISWNKGAEQIYGFTEKESVNMKIWSIVPDYCVAETEEMIQDVLRGKKIQDVETTRITKHGKLIAVQFAASLIVDTDNDKRSVAITERDMTNQKLAEAKIHTLNKDLEDNVEQMKLVNKELESFSYSISHDLRAPLRSINGYANILAEEYDKLLDAEGKKMLTTVRRNATHMGILIDELLAFSKLGRKPVEKTTINMNQMVNQIVGELESARKVDTRVTMHDLPAAAADKVLINQVWANLISNAFKYSSKKAEPVVEIGAMSYDTHIEYYVKDNGAGFSMEYANKLFGVFQRLHRSEEFEGTGVGLAIVYRIVTKHGGRVWAEASVDVGATFHFTLPTS
jgi:PAS domain S-box-containing protein